MQSSGRDDDFPGVQHFAPAAAEHPHPHDAPALHNQATHQGLGMDRQVAARAGRGVEVADRRRYPAFVLVGQRHGIAAVVVLGVGRVRTEERVKRMLAMVRLEGMGERRPSQLSGGQQQRVALARAAIYNPLLLLMDEPLSALDKNLREEMQFEVKQFQEALGATVLYVTHDQAEAASMSHRIAIINHGRIEQLGTAREMYERPDNRFVASFLGEADIFEVERLERRGGGAVAVTPEGLRLAKEGAEIIVQDIDSALAEESVAMIRDGGGRARAVVCDVADVAACTAEVAAVEAKLGHIDILVNNAGIDTPGELSEIDETDFERMFAIHVKGSFFMAKASPRA